MTDGGGSIASSMTFTAYGESVSGTAQRYGYAGAHGCQAGPEVPFQHLGHRYYDPSIGRFLQRDPIGIAGGLNVYAYAHARPTQFVDPLGLYVIFIPPAGPWVQLTPSDIEAAGKAIKRALPAIGGKIVKGLTGKSPVRIGGPLATCVGALGAAPDVVRIGVGVKLCGKVLEEAQDADDFLDRWERKRDKWVKPGRLNY